MLDRAHARPDGDLDPLGAVRVGRDEQAVPCRLLDRGADHRLRQLDDARLRPAGQHRAGDDALDERRAAAGEDPDLLADLVGRLDHAQPELRRQAELRGVAGDLAAAARARDVGAGALHPRPGRPAAVDGVAQRDVDERPERPDVADRGEPGPERRRGRCGRRSSPPRRPRRRPPGCRRTPARRPGGCGSR